MIKKDMLSALVCTDIHTAFRKHPVKFVYVMHNQVNQLAQNFSIYSRKNAYYKYVNVA